MAEAINFANVTTDEIRLKLLKLLEDPKYAIRSKRLSQSFRDQKETPLDRAVWWIEWVLRNPQPDYLTSPTLRLGHIVSSAFDVVAFLVTAIILTVFIVVTLASITIRAIWLAKKTSAPLHTHEQSKAMKTKKIL